MKETNHDLIATHEIIRVLETSLYFSRNIIDHQPDILIITDQESRIYRINHHGVAFLGKPKTEILGRELDELCASTVRKRFKDILKGDPRVTASFSNEDQDDDIKIYWQITRLVDEHLKMPLYLIKGTDTTELHYAYKKMEAINSEKQRIEDEIKKAKIIQETLLPDATLPQGIKLESIFIPAAETSGDWFGYHYDEPYDIFNVYVGDVTGHGLSSALLTGVVYGAVYSTEQMFNDHKDLFSKYSQAERLALLASAANSMILKADARLSMTMFFLSIEVKTGKTCFLNAGHRLPFLYKSSTGELTRIRGGGDVLGFSDEPRFEGNEFIMEPGDVIVLYTDGLFENKDKDGNVLKEKFMRQHIAKHAHNLSGLRTSCMEIIEAQGKDAVVDDDVAMIFISYKA